MGGWEATSIVAGGQAVPPWWELGCGQSDVAGTLCWIIMGPWAGAVLGR